MSASFTTKLVAAALLAAATLLPAIADDAGPHPDLRAIRGGLPVLLAAPLAAAGISERAQIRDVAVHGNVAAATWRAGAIGGSARLERRSDRWWLVAGTNPLAFWPGPHGSGASPKRLSDLSGGGCAVLSGVSPASGLQLRGRAPTAAEMPPSPGANAYYFFSLTSTATMPVAIPETTLDVWFPYVLDPAVRYTLWIGFTRPRVDGVPGTLHDNVLHFDLPSVTTIAGKEALGEIDGE